MEKVRAFIAIDFPDEVVKEVARVQSFLEKRKFIGKLTELENLHLTLKFLGEIEIESVDKVRNSLREIKFNSFEARLVEIGIFKHRGVPLIVWLKVGGKGIFDLQNAVDVACEACGFDKERRFMSHMTIARVKYVKAKKEFVDYVNGISVKKIRWRVDKFKIMRSELSQIGPKYSLIEDFSLVSS